MSAPTNFTPEKASGEDLYRIVVTNTGGASSDGTAVTISDELPAGLVPAAGGVSGEDHLANYPAEQSGAFKCEGLACTFTGRVAPDGTLVVTLPVDVMVGGEHVVSNVARVTGGGAPDTSVTTPTTISSSPASFGISPGSATTTLSSTQAGAHPDITTSIGFNTVNVKGSLAGEPNDLVTEEPPGFAGDLVDTPACPPVQFARSECPIGTQIGVTTLTLLQLGEKKPQMYTLPVYNLTPNPGEVAKFGFSVLGNFDIQGNVAVRPGDYGLRVSFHNTNQTGIVLDAVSLTVWGVPADPAHNTWRMEPGSEGQVGVGIGVFGGSSDSAPAPYFTNPTSCGETLVAKFTATSWEGAETQAGMPIETITGCDRLSFPATFEAVSTSNRTDVASGLNVNLNVTQTYDNAYGLASSTLRKAVVTLPEGMTVNPSEAAGLGACAQSQYEEEGLEVSAGKGCPSDSTIGSVSVETPSLKEKGTGTVFIAQPYANPFHTPAHPQGSLIALYVVIRFPERGVIAKLAGEVAANETTGRLVTTFEGVPFADGLPSVAGLPPVPFSSFVFKFIQGPTAPLVTPAACGAYQVSAAFTPWAQPEDILSKLAPPFTISQGIEEGSPCPSGGIPPFKPSVSAGTADNNAGSYSPLDLRIARNDGEQEITRFSSQLPPGLSANLSGVPFCSDAAIEAAKGKTGTQEELQPSCPAASQIGHTLVGAGVGSVLVWAPGKVYMAGPYNGAPFSIVAITSAKVGPFDLGTVVVREALEINPVTAVVTVDAKASDPIPHIIDGIVIHVRDIRVFVDRADFTLNPTSCERMGFQLTISGGGADPANPGDEVPVTVDNPFQAADCQNLLFKPTFKASTSGKTSRKAGASLSVKLTYPKAPQGSQANIRSVKVDLPKQLPSRLSTLQKACTDTTFEANPAMCSVSSHVGNATAITPILPVPLTGPAYFVSHGGAKFPELVIVLQGYGVTIDLHGETFISKGITSSTFRTVPDQPVTSFQLTLPEGPDSALAATSNLCKVKLKMPTAFTAQNGIVIHQSTSIAATGCPKKKPPKKVRKVTRR
ncbi:MAG TPA: hypothetical protein VIJ39_12365 [Solirubrobacteraceae bacterium]